MTIERLREVYEAQPFQPFTLYLADGRKIPVLSREYIMAPPTGRTVVVWQPKNDALNIIDLLLVTNLEIQRSRNGRRKSRKRASN